jgi:hypothetical protein
MKVRSRERLIRVAGGIYRAMLVVYPREFRARHGLQMKLAFKDLLREALSSASSMDFVRFCIRMARDYTASVLRERVRSLSATEIACLAGATGVGLFAAYVDHHNAREVYPTLSVVLVGSLVLGMVRPKHAWRWAAIVGLCIPFFGPLPTLTARLASPGAWAILAVVLIPGLLGAYTGSAFRRAAGSMR